MAASWPSPPAGDRREPARQFLLHALIHLLQQRSLGMLHGKMDEHQNHRQRQGQGGGVELQAQALENLEHRRLIRRLGNSAAPVKHHRDADHRPQEAEDRDRPDDDTEQAVTGVESGGIHVGQVLQLVVQRLGRTAVVDVLQSGPQPTDVIFALPPAGQAI